MAISGGVDSMVLLDLLLKGGYDVSVAHCNFQLRGVDSKQDEKFVENYCIRQGLDFFNRSFDTSKTAAEQQISIQMAARELRYSWFFELVDQHHFDYLLTAHHLNDSAETMLINLTRGTSIHGLKGIEFKNERVRRPLSSFNKKELKEYALELGIEWREDSSNQEDKYFRNAIRHHVIPELEGLNPSFLNQIEHLSEKNKAVERVWEKHMASFIESFVTVNDQGVSISKQPFISGEAGPFELHEILQRYGFKYEQCQSMVSAIENTGAQFISVDHTLFVDRNELSIKTNTLTNGEEFVISEEDRTVELGSMRLDLEYLNRPSSLNHSNGEYFSSQQIEYPLLLRKWKQGDKMRPLGMKGQKLVSDILIDKKVDLSQKSNVYVLVSGGQICWLVGYQISEDFKVKEADQKVLSISRIQAD